MENKEEKHILKIGKRFDSEHQPTTEARSKGQKNRWLIKKILNAKAELLDPKNAEVLTYLGLNDDERTIEALSILKQVRISLSNKGATQAFNALQDRAHGKPKQTVDTTVTEVRDIDMIEFIKKQEAEE